MTDSEATDRNESRDADTGEDLDLTEEQADSVKGGASDFEITKHVDKPTPGL